MVIMVTRGFRGLFKNKFKSCQLTFFTKSVPTEITLCTIALGVKLKGRSFVNDSFIVWCI